MTEDWKSYTETLIADALDFIQYDNPELPVYEAFRTVSLARLGSSKKRDQRFVCVFSSVDKDGIPTYSRFILIDNEPEVIGTLSLWLLPLSLFVAAEVYSDFEVKTMVKLLPKHMYSVYQDSVLTKDKLEKYLKCYTCTDQRTFDLSSARFRCKCKEKRPSGCPSDEPKRRKTK